MSSKKPCISDTNQVDRFKEAARKLDCEEGEAAFDEKLGKLVKQKPEPASQSVPKEAKK